MRRPILLLLAACLIALATAAGEPPVASQAVTKLTFTETSVSAPVAPGAMSGWTMFGRTYSGYRTTIYTDGGVITDSDHDGLVTWIWTRTATVPWNGIWVVTDLSTGEIMAGSRSTSAIPPSVTLAPNVFLRDQEGHFSHVILPVQGLASLQLQRPGVGAWYAYLEESGGGDLDGSLNGRLVLNVDAFKPVGSSPPAPEGVLPGDVFVGILFDPSAPPPAPGFEEVWFGDAVENHLGDTPGTATVSIANPYTEIADEESVTLRIPVLREETSDGTVTVQYASSPPNPNPGIHFEDFAGTLTFAPGEILKTIDVPIIDDDLYSGRSSFLVTLSSPAGATLGSVTTAAAEIRDTSDEAPSLSLSTTETSRLEGNSGVQQVPVTVTLGAPAARTITVNWSWREGYGSSTTGTSIFSPGETQKSFTMSYLANTTAEPDRQLSFSAAWQPEDQPTVTAGGSFTITDDDRPGVPQAFEAHYDGTGVSISWFPDPKAIAYELESASANTSWTIVYSGAATSFQHTAVQPGQSYIYRVRAVDANQNTSNWSQPDIATAIVFTDDPLSAGIVVKAAHLEELRTAVNAMLALAHFAPVTFNEPAGTGAPIRASHLLALREALSTARGHLGLSPVAVTDAVLDSSVPVKAIHLTELRHGCR